METISAETLSKVAHELIAHPSIEWMMDHLEAHQPELLNYVMLALDNFATEAGMKATQLTWFAFRGFELQSAKPIAKLDRDFILRHEFQNQGLANAGGNISRNAFMEIMALETSAQPYLMEFVRRSVAVSLTGSGPTEERVIKECVAVYLTVKTAIDSLDAATN